MEKSVKHKRIILTVFWVAVISSWLTFLFFFSIPLGLLCWITALVYLFFKRTRLKWYLLLASSWTFVPTWSFISGSKNYFQGKAAIKTVGFPNGEFYNLNPDLRVWNATSGCVVMGFEPFTQVPNNWAVRFWTALLGTQNGVYKGVYPTKQQAKDLMSKGEQVNLSKRADTFFLSYRNEPLYLQPDNDNDLYVLTETVTGKAFVFNNECLLMETTAYTTRRVILLADKNNGKIFARYYDSRGDN
jgi:hypothetical protein